MMKKLAKISLLVMLINLAACSGFSTTDETVHWTAEKIYHKAKAALEENDYAEAIRLYELLEARYPFGDYAKRAQLEVIYAYYKNDEPQSAIASADRFIRLYPSHQHVDYVYYLKGLVHANMNAGLFDRFLPLRWSQRDQTTARQAFQDFKQLTQLFPKSRYVPDAQQRMIFLRNNMATFEASVAHYYLQRGAYVAAVNRAQVVIENYQRTAAVADALVIMTKAYRVMGMEKLALDAFDVLKLNYPDHKGIAEIRAMQLDS